MFDGVSHSGDRNTLCLYSKYLGDTHTDLRNLEGVLCVESGLS